MRKIILIIVLVIVLSSCQENSEDVVEPIDENKELVILVPNISNRGDYKFTGKDFITYFSEQFSESTGRDVIIEPIDYESYNEYIEQGISEFKNQSFDLLFLYKPSYPFNNLLEEVGLNISNQISNMDKMYVGLKHDYYIPIALSLESTPLNKKIFDKYNIPVPSYDWTVDDYIQLTIECTEKDNVYLEYFQYTQLYDIYFNDIIIENAENNNISLDVYDILNRINALEQEIFSGRYIIRDNYNNENYRNALLDIASNEFKMLYRLSLAERKNSLLIPEVCKYGANFLNAMDCNNFNNDEMLLTTPLFDTNLYSYGFMVNKNTQNMNGAIDFINYMLSDEIQLNIYKEYGMTRRHISGVVNKDVEEEIYEYEKANNINENTIELRKYLYNAMDEGKYNLYRSIDYVFNHKLYEKVVEIIFSDISYSDEDKIKMIEDFVSDYSMQRE